jgi:hypothetical protein
MNVMPIAARWRCAMVVHRDYESLVSGCSAIDVQIWDGSLEDPQGAADWARKRYSNVIITQLFGRGGRNDDRHCSQYCLDEWHRAGCLEHHGKWPLYFDLRSEMREAELVKKYDDGRPMLLLSLKGVSGPYKDADRLRGEIIERWGQRLNIVDLPSVKAKRFYDLLGLYDMAALLVTIDTSTLHLAAASQVPAIELLSFEPEDWHGSVPRGNCILSMKYREVRGREAEIHEMIAQRVNRCSSR